MTTKRYIRIIAGTSVLASLPLGTRVNHNWYWFTALVGANLFQSGFTNWWSRNLHPITTTPVNFVFALCSSADSGTRQAVRAPPGTTSCGHPSPALRFPGACAQCCDHVATPLPIPPK
jgi:hypothetical protein